MPALGATFIVLSTLICSAPPAQAQAIIMTVNGDPVTNIDQEQRIKLLRALRKPATSEAANESLIDEHVKSTEVKKYGIKFTDADVNQQILRVATGMKIDPNALLADIQRAGVASEHFKSYFGVESSFNLLVQALNKGVEASESEIRAELAKEGGKAAAGTEYTVRQIILPLPATAAPGTIEARSKEAEQLRARFTDCTAGVASVQAMTDVVIKNPISRTSLQLGGPLKQLLDTTPIGHVTPPQRTTQGFEMLALCSRGSAKDDTSARDAISQRLLSAHYATAEDKLLKELRSHAVVQKR